MTPVKLKSEKQTYLLGFEPSTFGVFPSTRYQGSKNKIIDWIKYCMKGLKFETVLDAFGGTGSVSYMLKKQGKQVFYNDYLQFNTIIGQALIENNKTLLENEDLNFLFTRRNKLEYPTFIFDNFQDIYFTDRENKWLDLMVTNIGFLENKYKKALAFFALFQTCLIKRPYNLFHRKNLYIRKAQVERSFGNKKTWDTPFEQHFLKFVEEVNNAVFDNGKHNLSFNEDILDWRHPSPDLVYIDTPYISKKGIGVNYFDFYHFLEGLTKYKEWGAMIDKETKHKKIKNEKNQWCNKTQIHKAFKKLFQQFQNSKLVISYRDDGIPTIKELIEILKELGKKIEVKQMNYKYVLSNTNSKEVLIIAV